MNIANRLLSRVFAVAFICLLPALAIAKSNPLGEEQGTFFGSVVVPEGTALADVKALSVKTLAHREWNVMEQTDTKVVGYLKHRSNEAKVTLLYTAEKVDIYCVGWDINKKTGARLKPEQPKGWLKNIQGDLTKRLNEVTSTN